MITVGSLDGKYNGLVSDAEGEAEDAQSLVDALEDRIRDGDEKVTPEALEDATRLSRFAALRVEAAKKKAAAARRADAADQLEAAAAGAVDFLGTVGDLSGLEEKAAAALRALVVAVEAQRTEGRRVGAAFAGAASVAKELGVPGASAPERVVRVSGNERVLTMSTPGDSVRWEAEKVNASAALRRVLEGADLRTRPSAITVFVGPA